MNPGAHLHFLEDFLKHFLDFHFPMMTQRIDPEWLRRCINLGMAYCVHSFQIDELFVLIAKVVI